MGSSEEKNLNSALRQFALNSLQSFSADALKDTDEGGWARRTLYEMGIETTSLGFTEVSDTYAPDPHRNFLMAPDRDSVGEFAPSVDWFPRVDYSVYDVDDEKVIKVESSILLPGDGEARAEVSVENLSNFSPDVLPERCFTELEEKIEEITETVASQQKETRHTWTRSRKGRIVEKRKQLESHAEALLHDASSILSAWALVALVEEGEVLPNKSLEAGRDFVSEAQKLWKSFCRRHLSESGVSLTGIGELAGVPPPVTGAADFALRAIYEELSAIDEEILSLRIESVACEIVEDRVIEGAPSLSERGSTDTQPHPEETAEKIFAGKRRAEGANTHLPNEVREWIHDAYWDFCGPLGLAPESAKDRVISIAEGHDYHFSRKTLERIAHVGKQD